MAKPRLDDPLTADQLRALLDYDRKAGKFFWRTRKVFSHHDRTWNTRYAGTLAGHPKAPYGYNHIKINDQQYRAARLAWLWMTGSWPDDEVAHIDTDPTNDRWRNLRVATPSQQKMNRGMRSNNTSGAKGVWYDKRRAAGARWRAEILAYGKKYRLGSFPTLLDAKAARDEAAKRLHGKFARTD